MPTKSKAQVKADHDAGLVVEDSRVVLGWGADYPSALEQAAAAFKALNALAEAIRASATKARKGKANAEPNPTVYVGLGHQTEKPKGGE